MDETVKSKSKKALQELEKAPTGISGLDEVTGGGLPAGRPTLICGSAGSGKTLFASTFLHNGATEFDEPGVFMSFEEPAADIVKNVASLGYHFDDLIKRKKLIIDFVRIERAEIEETGEYDLEGLFIRLSHAIDSIGAKRVVLDTIESLFGGLGNLGVLRAELRRLFTWLKEKGVTAIVTGERGDGQLTRHGLEEYVSDCVILLDNRVIEEVTTRRLRVVKYRGAAHGTNEYPFLLDDHGITVMPITAVGLSHGVSEERISSGIPDLDAMLVGGGFYRGSSILVSGMAGTGKTSISAHFVDAACRRGERALYFAAEESPHQIVRNMRSIGVDLQPWVDKGLLHFHAARPTLYGLEMHLATMHREIEEAKPAIAVLDPMSAFADADQRTSVHAMILRLIDVLKSRGITSVFTNLTHGNIEAAKTDVQVSSLMDSWLLLYNKEVNGEHNRQLYLIKSRGMAHSNQVREFLMTDRGVALREVYLGPSGVLTGSARLAQEAREKAAARDAEREFQRREREFEHRRRHIMAQIEQLQQSLALEEEELQRIEGEAKSRGVELAEERKQMALSRKVATARAEEYRVPSPLGSKQKRRNP